MLRVVLALIVTCLCHPVSARDAVRNYANAVAGDVPRVVLWGDVHLHTSYSADAYSQGNVNLGLEEAYRFAMGEAVTVQNGLTVRLRRPLDFLAVTDHAEYLGVFPKLAQPGMHLSGWKTGAHWAELIKNGDLNGVMREFADASQSSDPSQHVPDAITGTIWDEVTKTADLYYRRGKFTTLIGYEWSSMSGGNNLHRCVLYRDGADMASKALPFSAQDSPDPEQLWQSLAAYERKTGGKVMAIPHNGNLSNGLMFSPKRYAGRPIDAEYAAARSHWEPLYEVTQIKGTGEAHPLLSPEDEFANFEIWDKENIFGTAPKERWMLQYEYVRSALESGLKFKSQIGTNPFKFGMVGSTDSHISLTAVEEDAFFGKTVQSLPSADRATENLSILHTKNWEQSASGRVAVWAKENSREEIFDAMKRREVYATTGSRIVVRFFGGWDYPVDSDLRPDLADIGYAGGVPMGGDLAPTPHERSPVFILAAMKDPDEANLDRIQVIKGWLDRRGELHEKVYDVALSGGRRVDPSTGKAPPVGSTVNVTDATYTNSIGAAVLSATWVDRDFDAREAAFYYARVIEIPKPRWTAYDAKFFRVRMPDEVPMTIQDRAITSPIWYTPDSASPSSDIGVTSR